jgi:hypothetical protein
LRAGVVIAAHKLRGTKKKLLAESLLLQACGACSPIQFLASYFHLGLLLTKATTASETTTSVFDSVNWHQLRAPSIRLFPGEWVGRHKSKRHEIMLSQT